jgi:His-Xaa-Ser system protein HxsD
MAASRRPAPRKPASPKTEDGDLVATVGLGSITLSLDPKLYPLSVIHGAAYVFLPRAFVRLERKGGRVEVRLTGKQKLDRGALEALAGEFANELVNQFVREDVAAKTTRLREAVVGRALLGALGTGDELSGLADDPAYAGPDSTPALADPLGIAQDWEVRFGRPADKNAPEPRTDKLHAYDPGTRAAASELGDRGLAPEPPIPYAQPKK